MNKNILKAGAAIVDISPGPGIQLVGYPYKKRENIGIHDPLYATCIFLDDGKTKLIIICADLVYFEKPFVKSVRRCISREINISSENIMLSASHTHSGPCTYTWWPALDTEDKGIGYKSSSKNIEYMERLKTKMVDIASKAYHNAEVAKIGFGAGHVGKEHGIGGNRHDPDGLYDPTVMVMGVQDRNGKWIASLVKYSLHPAILQEDNLLVSADYPCYIRKYLAHTKPGSILLFAQGSTGDQSSRYFRKGQTFEEAKRFGKTIGKEADRVLTSLTMTDYVKLETLNTKVMPELRDIPRVDEAQTLVDKYKNELEKLQKSNVSYAERQTCSRNLLGAEFTLYYAKYKKKGKIYPVVKSELPIEIQVFKIGNCCLMAIQGEIFVKYTLAIEKASPFKQTFVITIANGFLPGYVVTEEASKKQLFEAGTSLMKPETGKMIVESALNLINEIYD